MRDAGALAAGIRVSRFDLGSNTLGAGPADEEHVPRRFVFKGSRKMVGLCYIRISFTRRSAFCSRFVGIPVPVQEGWQTAGRTSRTQSTQNFEVIVMGSLGPFEILLIFLVILLVFGAKRIPEIARGLGKGIREFKSATTEIKNELTVDPTPSHRIHPPSQGSTAPRSDSSYASSSPAKEPAPAQKSTEPSEGQS